MDCLLAPLPRPGCHSQLPHTAAPAPTPAVRVPDPEASRQAPGPHGAEGALPSTDTSLNTYKGVFFFTPFFFLYIGL